jgi:hypothetical protein
MTRNAAMNPKNSIQDRKRPIAGWHFIAVAGVFAAVATFFAFPTESAKSAEVISGPRSDTDAGSREAETHARDYRAWLRDAHSKTHRDAEAQPLPDQF